jgi:thymidylate synthase (FAD)
METKMRTISPSVELLFITPNAAQLIEAAGRTCYKSENKITNDSAEKFVAMVSQRGHHSVIEHAYATFRVITDRGITHEIVRHRIASYSQESSRYCNYGKAKFGKELTLIPPSFKTEQGPDIWRRAALESEKNYFDMLEAGEPPEIARGVLLTNQKTEIVITANFREWLHFLMLRTAPAAHPDMRIVAKEIGGILNQECPEVFHNLPAS